MVDYTNYLCCRYMLYIDLFVSKDEMLSKGGDYSQCEEVDCKCEEFNVSKKVNAYRFITALTHTTAVTSHEVSIPAFLQKQCDSDFSISQFIAKGGGGKVNHCNSHNDEITAE